MKIKYNSQTVRLVGNIALYFGILSFLARYIIGYIKTGSLTPSRFDIAVGSGTSATIIASLLILVVSNVLKNIEDRLTKIEEAQSKSRNQ